MSLPNGLIFEMEAAVFFLAPTTTNPTDLNRTEAPTRTGYRYLGRYSKSVVNRIGLRDKTTVELLTVLNN
jgi:hypothetical protein